MYRKSVLWFDDLGGREKVVILQFKDKRGEWEDVWRGNSSELIRDEDLIVTENHLIDERNEEVWWAPPLSEHKIWRVVEGRIGGKIGKMYKITRGGKIGKMKKYSKEGSLLPKVASTWDDINEGLHEEMVELRSLLNTVVENCDRIFVSDEDIELLLDSVSMSALADAIDRWVGGGKIPTIRELTDVLSDLQGNKGEDALGVINAAIFGLQNFLRHKKIEASLGGGKGKMVSRLRRRGVDEKVWGEEFDALNQSIEMGLDSLLKLVEEGKAKSYGVSNEGIEELGRMWRRFDALADMMNGFMSREGY